MYEEALHAQEFYELPLEERVEYIRQRLHLDDYETLTGESSPEGNRLIGSMRYNQGGTYTLHPIDCRSTQFNGGILFADDEENGIRLSTGQFFQLDRPIAVQAIRNSNLVSAEFSFPDGGQPLEVSSLRRLKPSPAELREMIHSRTRLAGKGKELGGIEAELKTKSAELTEVRNALKAQKAELASLQTRLKNQSGQLREVEASLESKTAEMKAIKPRLQRKNMRLQELEQAIADKEGRLQSIADGYLALGLDLPEPLGRLRKEEIPVQEAADLNQLTEQTQDFLAGKRKLFYADHVIREFLGAMYSNQLIILSGPPGTGKSSLPPAIASCIGAECRMVSVQPSWTDNQDLLGFYDPTRARFSATPFLDILAEAAQNPGQIYLVCLDEMNLARAEYYFSEVLSAMETADKTLHLYSAYAYELRQKALARQIPPPDAAPPEDFGQLQEQWNTLCRYPAEFAIPDNVQFVGTLNMDESTKGLSPKVLDRSFIIEVQGAPDRDAPENPEQPGRLSPDAFRQMEGGSASAGENLEKLKDLARQLDHLAPRRATLSRRGQARALELLRRGLTLEDVFLGRILPAVSLMDVDSEAVNALVDALQPYPQSAERFQQMYDPELRELYYWR